jgi:4-hydroxybutyrate dehydrogenase
MNIFNFPTTIYSGQGAIEAFVNTLRGEKLLIVTDAGLRKVGLVDQVTALLDQQNIKYAIFDGTHPNPIEEDVIQGAEIYHQQHCQALLAIGGGSSMDVAKIIKIAVSHDGPLQDYEISSAGAERIINAMPKLYAIATTAGTGSEVGRSAVIMLKGSDHKNIFFHPKLIPDIAILAPEMTIGLPPHITAATGIDAFTHNLEAWLAPHYHPMADGIALEGLRLILEYLPIVVADGQNIEAREQMLVASMMGATAFQKGLGMVHSLAHPLSAVFDLHHGLSNALVLPFAIEFLENASLNDQQKKRLDKIQQLFTEAGLAKQTLSQSCHAFIASLGINFGLSKQGISKDDLERLSQLAFADGCHQDNLIAVNQQDFYAVYQKAL